MMKRTGVSIMDLIRMCFHIDITVTVTTSVCIGVLSRRCAKLVCEDWYSGVYGQVSTHRVPAEVGSL